MQRTEKYFENDAFRKSAAGVILAAEADAEDRRRDALLWTARCSTPRAADSLPTGAL